MPSKDFDRMIQLGEWLEEYLGEEIKSWKSLKLAQKFVQLYSVDFKVKKNDLSFKVAGLMDNATPEKKNKINSSMNAIGTMDDFMVKLGWKYKPRDGLYDSLFEVQTEEGKEALKIITESLQGLVGVEFQGHTITYDDCIEWIIYTQNQVAHFFQVKPVAKYFLEKISKKSKPWNIVLADETIFDDTLFGLPHETGAIGVDPEDFFGGYEGLVDRLQTFDNEVKVVSAFAENKIWAINDDGNHESVFPWIVAVSRIFFDFLLLGGQDYFLFCEYCGRFTVIRRKGRKKYCSDVCRTTHGREKRAN